MLNPPDPGGRRIAIVGAGPAGLYALQAALARPEITGADVFEALPAPYGLVRYGVAADHAKTKSVTRVFQKLLDSDQVRFFGNLTVGSDLSVDELRRHYDAVIYSTGAREDRDLGIDGERLPGSVGAAQFVSWYSGHPDAEEQLLLASSRTAVVVGAGNVALDIVRILAKHADELLDTDMPASVLDALARSALTDIHLLARRGPEHARFTAVELREMGELANADVLVDPDDLLDPATGEPITPETPSARTNLKLISSWAEREPAGRPRRIHLHFWSSPLELRGAGRVEQVRVRRQRPGHPATERVIEAEFVVRAIGYRARALPGLPFDPERCVVPNHLGRILDAAGERRIGEYVCGWLKRGPSGVIGTNRGDANETVAALAEDLAQLPPRQVADPTVLPAQLRAAGVRVVDWAGWKRLERHESGLGSHRGTASVKLTDRAAILEICHGLTEVG